MKIKITWNFEWIICGPSEGVQSVDPNEIKETGPLSGTPVDVRCATAIRYITYNVMPEG